MARANVVGLGWLRMNLRRSLGVCRRGKARKSRIPVWRPVLRFAALLLLTANTAAAQPMEGPSLSGAGGLSWRSSPDVVDCCGPAWANPPQVLQLNWVGTALGVAATERLGVEGEVTWKRPMEYQVVVQAALAGQPARVYQARHRVGSLTLAALSRWRVWHARSAGAIDLVGGAGVARGRRQSVLSSFSPRPGPVPVTPVTLDVTEVDYELPAIVGVDVLASRGRTSIAAQCRLHWRVTGGGPDETGFPPSARDWRIGAAYIRRF